LIFRNVMLKNKILIRGEELIDTLRSKEPEVLITMGAGDIDTFVEAVKQLLIKKYG
jgi:UDP-N-acetylmuramate--alanine ligase